MGAEGSRSSVVTLRVDGADVEAPGGKSLAAFLLEKGKPFRRSASGEPRQPLCAMGTCFECRVTVDDVPHVRACRVVIRNGLVVETASRGDRG